MPRNCVLARCWTRCRRCSSACGRCWGAFSLPSRPRTSASWMKGPLPTTRGTRRLAGIDLNKARNRLVVDAVVALSTRPNGFPVAELGKAVRQRSGQDANMYSARNAAYDLAKLIGKTLVRRIERSRRYAADPPGVRTLCAYLLLREKLHNALFAGL